MKTAQITEWKDLTEMLEEIPVYKDCIVPRWIFRGQSSSKWSLFPSLLRKAKKYKLSKEITLGYETMTIREFEMKYHNYTDLKIPIDLKFSSIVLLSVMQHYCCPTRMLDWTESPYVGLFFAVENDFDEDGALFLFNSTLLDKINEEDLKPMRDLAEYEIFDYPFKNIIYPFYTSHQNNRTISQGGLYTLSTNIELDHETLIDGTFKLRDIDNCFYKIIIPYQLKLEFLSRLKTMNITKSTLFNDLDGLGKYIGQLIDIRHFIEN